MPEQTTPQIQPHDHDAELETKELEEVAGGADSNTNCFAICGSKPADP